MLIRVVVDGLRTLRRAGWPVLLLAFAYLAAIAVVLPQPGLLLFVGIAAQNLVTFALIRHLAARRGIEPKRDGPPLPTRAGQVLLASRKPGPVDEGDRSARQALRNAGYLLRPAVRLGFVQLLGALTIIMLIVSIGGDRVMPGADESPTDAQTLRLLIGLVPVAALVSAFIATAPQRIAIEGDHRVILAVVQAVRIARASYGTVFVLSLIEPLTLLAEVAAGDSAAIRVTAVVVHPLLRLVVVAALNEVYAAAPALVPPAAVRDQR